jgi:hypothetical protein
LTNAAILSILKIRKILQGPVAQLGARLNGIQKVRGSSPLRSTKKIRKPKKLLSDFSISDFGFFIAGVTQLVEYHVANVTVAGSNPVSRSKSDASKVFVIGGVAKWLRRRSAKSLCSGSNPLAASKR